MNKQFVKLVEETNQNLLSEAEFGEKIDEGWKSALAGAAGLALTATNPLHAGGGPLKFSPSHFDNLRTDNHKYIDMPSPEDQDTSSSSNHEDLWIKKANESHLGGLVNIMKKYVESGDPDDILKSSASLDKVMTGFKTAYDDASKMKDTAEASEAHSMISYLARKLGQSVHTGAKHLKTKENSEKKTASERILVHLKNKLHTIDNGKI